MTPETGPSIRTGGALRTRAGTIDAPEDMEDGIDGKQEDTQDLAVLELPIDSVLEELPVKLLPEAPETRELEAPSRSEEEVPELPYAPLLKPRWTRAILTASLATTSPDHGPLDLEAVVDAIARGEVIERPPRVAWPTLQRGAEVLIDCGAGMAPFTRDQEQLWAAIRAVAGADRVVSKRFVGAPDLAERRGEPYSPPPRGTVIVILSDLGIARHRQLPQRADESEWVTFAERARQAGCPTIAFVPYPLDRWPNTLRAMFVPVQWDRRTTVQAVRNRVGRGHRVG